VADKKIEDFANSVPESLFHYCSLRDHRLQWANEMLADRFYFSLPSQFNDPLDCHLPVSFKAAPNKIRQHFRRHGRDKGLQGHELEDHIKRMVKKNAKMNQDKLRQNLDKNVGILCLSETATNPLMWSYYGDAHAGICFEVNPIKCVHQSPVLYMPLQVTYTEELPSIDYFKYKNEWERYGVLFGTKAKYWDHEKEWRLISLGQNGTIRLVSSMLRSVTFGVKTPNWHKEILKMWIKKRKIKIDIYEASWIEGRFKLTREKVKYLQ
jgi:hypothetical protein